MTTYVFRTLMAALVALLATAAPGRATTFIVNNGGDVLGTGVGSGICETASGNGICTLRRAVAEANILMPPGTSGALPEVTIIVTAPLVTIAPASAPLVFTGRGVLSIFGGGQAATTVEASNTNLFDFSGSTGKVVRIGGVSILHAVTTMNGTGGLSLEGVTLANSGTVLRWTGGPVTITGSTIRDNNGTAVHGSPIVFTGPADPAPAYRIRRTTLRGNTGVDGGAIDLIVGNLDLEVVTFNNNVGTRGGAIFVDAAASLRATNSTFVANWAGLSGGALFMNGRAALPAATAGTTVLAHVTVSANRADADLNGSGTGGGIAVTSGTTGLMAIVTLDHTLMSGNEEMIFTSFWVAVEGECDGPLVASGPTIFNVADCPVSGVAPLVADPELLPFINNGGPTQTRVPGSTSVAINAGSAAPCRDAYGLPITRDQRGHVTPVPGTTCDLGAVERDGAAVAKGIVGDLDGDRRADIVWRHAANGANAYWQMNGGTLMSGAYLTTVPDPGFTIDAIDDFDADGRADLLWRHTNGTNAVWLMNGPAIDEASFLPSVPNSASEHWRVVGTGDLDGDGYGDVVWEQLVWDGGTATFVPSGRSMIWLMDGMAIKGVRLPADLVGWRLVGVGDSNGDGTSDLLWRELGSGGGTRLWLMASGAVATVETLPTVNEDGWLVVGFADIDGDGNADIVWRNTQSLGHTAVWLMDGGTLIGGGYLPSVDPVAWTLVRIQDMDGDNRADFVWRAIDGQNAWWRMNGLTLLAAGYLTTVPDTGWQIK